MNFYCDRKYICPFQWTLCSKVHILHIEPTVYLGRMSLYKDEMWQLFHLTIKVDVNHIIISNKTEKGQIEIGRTYPLAHNIHWCGRMYFQSQKQIYMKNKSNIWIKAPQTSYWVQSFTLVSKNWRVSQLFRKYLVHLVIPLPCLQIWKMTQGHKDNDHMELWRRLWGLTAC